jgi:ABC-type nickel/cobalt efflux system permease component RcnA
MVLFRAAVMAIVFVWTAASVAAAHPLGNFTSNHLTRITVEANAVRVHYVLDDAEIPTFALLRALDAAGRPTHAALTAWAAGYAKDIQPQLRLEIDGHAVPLTLTASAAELRPGAAGLRTLYFTADYRAARPPGVWRLHYADETLPGRLGWKDVVVGAQPEPTQELRAYPDGLLGSPRDRTTIVATIEASGAIHTLAAGAANAAAAGASTARMNDLAAVLARDLTDPRVLIAALLLAVALGALHALEPGHGKTLLAVSLVGSRATVPQALILASSLTVAHTIGVLVFGAVVLLLARVIVPETLYPWIALASGSLVAVLGARAFARELAHRRDHAHGHHHHHHHHDHHHQHVPTLSFGSTALAASIGNLAPCPAALVVLLAAIATHRVGYGLVLIVAFSVGLALTLTGLGVAVVRGAAWLSRRRSFDRFAHHAPLASAALISLIGAWMIGEGVSTQNAGVAPVWIVLPVLAAIAAYAVLTPALRRVS